MSDKSFRNSIFKRIIDLGIVRQADVNDLVRIWRKGTGDEKAITLQNFVATVDHELGTNTSTLTEIINELEGRVETLEEGGGSDENKVSYNVNDNKNATERRRARNNIGVTSMQNQIVATGGNLDINIEANRSIKFTSSSVNLRGMTPLLDGEEVSLVNETGADMTIEAEASGVTANRRFSTGTTIPDKQYITVKYNGETGRYELPVIGGSVGADGNKVSYNQADNKNATERAQARVNIGAAEVIGSTWVSRLASEQNEWIGIAYGEGIFVAVALTGTNRIMTSQDGVHWQAIQSPNQFGWLAVTYGNGKFVSTSDSATFMYSSDSINWNTVSVAQENSWSSIIFGKGLFVSVSEGGTNRVITSPDGITWTLRNASSARQWRAITYGRGIFVAVSVDGFVMTSPDGINWTERIPPSGQWVSVTYGNGLFVAVSGFGTNRIMTSPDGITWTARNDPEQLFYRSVTYGNGVFVAVSASGTNRIISSIDGISWQLVPTPELNTWERVVYGNGVFVAISRDGTNRVMTSGFIIDPDIYRLNN
jgi:hypothetical protein